MSATSTKQADAGLRHFHAHLRSSWIWCRIGFALRCTPSSKAGFSAACYCRFASSEIFDLVSNYDCVHENFSFGFAQNDGGKQKTANPKVRRLGGVIDIQLFDSSFFFLPGPEKVFFFIAHEFLAWKPGARPRLATTRIGKPHPGPVH